MRDAHVSRRNELIAFFALTFVLSWAIEIPLALSAQGMLRASPPMALHYLASFGPLLAALIVTLAARGPGGLRTLLARVFRWRAAREYLPLRGDGTHRHLRHHCCY